jgi:hypothetical protein
MIQNLVTAGAKAPNLHSEESARLKRLLGKSSPLNERPSGAEARSDSGLFKARLETAPFQNVYPDSSFSAVCEAAPFQSDTGEGMGTAGRVHRSFASLRMTSFAQDDKGRGEAKRAEQPSPLGLRPKSVTAVGAIAWGVVKPDVIIAAKLFFTSASVRP